MKEVEGKSEAYAQEFYWNEEFSYKIKFTLNTTTKKGKSEEIDYRK